MKVQSRPQINSNQESIQQILSQIPKDIFIDAYRKYCPSVNDRTTARQVQQLCYLHSLAMQLTAIVSADMHRVVIHQQLQNDVKATPTQPLNKNMFDQYEYRSETQAINRTTDKLYVHAQQRDKKLEVQGQGQQKRQYAQKDKGGSFECDTSSHHQYSNRQPTQVCKRFDQFQYEGPNKNQKHEGNKSATKNKQFQKTLAQNQSKKTKLLGFQLLQPVENQKNKPASTRQMFLLKERNRMFANQGSKNQKQKKQSIQFQKNFTHKVNKEPSTQELDQRIFSRYQNYNRKIQSNLSKEPKGKSKGRNQQRCYRCQKPMNISNKQFKRNEGLCQDCRCQSNQIISSRIKMNFSQQFGF